MADDGPALDVKIIEPLTANALFAARGTNHPGSQLRISRRGTTLLLWSGLSLKTDWGRSTGGKRVVCEERWAWAIPLGRDIVIAGYLDWMRIIWSEDSQQWKTISSQNEGRWARISSRCVEEA